MSKKTKILILGGGFAGVFSAKNLLKKLSKSARKNIEIELISENNYFTFQPLLPEVSSGVLNPHDAVSPLRAILPKVKHRLASVQHVDSENKVVHVLQGQQKKRIEVAYDELVLACGQTSQLGGVRGLAEHGFTMKDLGDAFLLRNHVLKCLELGDVTSDPAVKTRALTFITIGAGFSGVETTGELQDMVKRALKYYPNIGLSEVRFILLQRSNRILEQLTKSLADYAYKKLQQRGVDIRLNADVVSASSEYIEINDGEKIDALTIIATIGSKALDFVHNSFETNLEKVIVDEYMQVIGKNHIWALGDVTSIPMKHGDKVTYTPPTAQFAISESKTLAHNLLAHLNNEPLKAFYFEPVGLMASLGSYQAVVDIYKLRLSGILAWAIWRGVYITKVPGTIAKVRITLNWMMDYLFPRTLVQVSPFKAQPINYLHFSKGDVICNPNEVINHFYLIVLGSVLYEKDGGSKVLNTQQYFGANSAIDSCIKITALENSKILKMNNNEFLTLRQDFKSFDKIFI